MGVPGGRFTGKSEGVKQPLSVRCSMMTTVQMRDSGYRQHSRNTA